jgi:transcriptional regulator of arginine metabolism
MPRTLSRDTGAEARRAAIRKVLRASPVGTQEALRELLSAEGFEVTQATLSRDLAQLGARRVSLPGGGTTYELEKPYAPYIIVDGGTSIAREPPSPPYGQDPLRDVGDLVLSVADNGSLVVVRTLPGAASAAAHSIDQLRLPQILGTLAGDDTIFLAPARGVPASKVTQRLRTLLGKGKNR